MDCRASLLNLVEEVFDLVCVLSFTIEDGEDDQALRVDLVRCMAVSLESR